MDEDLSLFRSIVESTTDGIWIFDREGRTTYANDQLARILGRDSSEMTTLSVMDVLDEVGQCQLREHLARLDVADVGADNIECSMLRGDGTRIWVLVSHSPLRDQNGDRSGWLHRVTEYTDRKILLDQVLSSQQQLAQAQSIARVGSWEWDVPTDTVTWSDELYRIYNLDPQEFEATYAGFLEFVHPDDRAEVEAAVGSGFTGADSFEFQVRIVRRGGEEGWVSGRGVVERDASGAPVKMGGTANDITHSKRAEIALAEASARYRLLQAMATAANESVTLKEALEVAAVELPRHTGWRPTAVYTLDEERRLEPLGLDAIDSHGGTTDPSLVEQVLHSRRTKWFTDPEPASGSPRGLIAIPVLLEGDVICVIELSTEPHIEPDPALLETIGQVASQLSRVAERERVAAQLAAARDSAMEASRLKSEFLTTMSHEIRTPMNGVIGLNDLLLRTQLDDHQRRLAKGVQSAGQTLLGLINDILDLSKIEAGKLELETVEFDVRAVFEQTAVLLSEPARAKGIELVVACHPEIPSMLAGDPVRLGQILANLGSNAVKFTDEGEVVIHARLEEETASTVTIRVDVTDTGVGIPEDAQGRLFDAFSQADASTTRQYGGTGLGLAISRRLVNAVGGDIGVTSTVGEGSTFWFTARFRKAPESSRPASRPTGAVEKRHLVEGLRVLVVDDNATNRLILTEQLGGWQMVSTEVDSAPAALEAMRAAAAAGEPFDLALLDMCMPGQDGLSLARQIRDDASLAGVRLILISSSNMVERPDIESAGIDDLLSKPLMHSQLYDSLVQVVGAVEPEPQRARSADATKVPTHRVLVVEDNPVNQLVATGVLESLGYATDVVEDGLEAVAALSRGHGYDAVLMDCQMPRLDGYDATRSIRDEEPEGERVPVIAMTASAVQGERERCLAAGMDDFLTKPIDPKALGRVLRSWIHSSGEADGRRTDGGHAEDGVLDRTRLGTLHDLSPTDTSLFDRFVSSFVTTAPESLAMIRVAVDADDAEALVASAHRLKGSALNLGVPLVGALCLELEMLGDEGHTKGAAEKLEQLGIELDRALDALHQVQENGL